MLEISLVVPVKNEAIILKSFINQVLKLNTLPSEIIFIDTGSIDESINIINSFSSKFSNIGIKFKLLKLQNAYPGAARNFGIVHAHYSWICFLDVGIYPEGDWLENLWCEKNLFNFDLIFGYCKFNSASYIGRIICALSYGVNKNLPVLPASLVHKKVFERTGYFNDRLRSSEDILWKRKVIEKGIKFHESKIARVNYTEFPDSILKVISKWFTYSMHESIASVTLYYKKFLYLLFFLMFIFIFVNIKITILVFLFYFFFRGLIDPLRKSMFKKWWLYNTQFFIAPFLALIIDISSMLGYFYGKYTILLNRIKFANV